jgi:hypothetical protein
MNEEQPKKRLIDIVSKPQADIESLFDNTEAANEFTLLPAGTYTCRVASGSRHQSRSGTPSYRLEFAVDRGNHTGRKLWLDLWLTANAMPSSKRDLLKLRIDSAHKLNQELPAGYLADVRVVLRKDDSGTERNEVRSFTVIGFDPPKPDTFAPEAGL